MREFTDNWERLEAANPVPVEQHVDVAFEYLNNRETYKPDQLSGLGFMGTERKLPPITHHNEQLWDRGSGWKGVVPKVIEGWKTATPLERGMETLSWAPTPGLPAKGAALIPPLVGGIIRGVSKPKAAAIRRTMQAEKTARGAFKETGDKLVDMASSFLRGTFFHGRHTHVPPGAVYTGARMKTGNVAEAKGLSLTADPGLYKVAFNKQTRKQVEAEQKLYNQTLALIDRGSQLQEKLRLYKGTETEKGIKRELQHISKRLEKLRSARERQVMGENPVARVMPLFSGDPVQQTLFTWQGNHPLLRRSHEALKDAYITAVKRQPQLWGTDVSGAYVVPDLKDFRKALQQEPEELAYRLQGELNNQYAFLASQKGDSSELMEALDHAQTLVFQDLLGVERKADVGRFITDFLTGAKLDFPVANQTRDLLGRALAATKQTAGKGEFQVGRSLLPEWRTRLDVDKLNMDMSNILQQRGYKGMMHGADRYKGKTLPYGEAELRMFNPEDVMNIDMRRVSDKPVSRYAEFEKQVDRQIKGKTSRTVTERARGSQAAANRRLRVFLDKTKNAPGSMKEIWDQVDWQGLRLELE